MKQLTTILAFLIATSFCNAQTKHYLQQVLTNSTISNFFNIDNDNIVLIKGIEDEDSKRFIDGEIKGYSSKYECYIIITTNSVGKIDGIDFLFKGIRSIERYKGIIAVFVEKNTGYSVTVPIDENFSKKYKLVIQQNRLDEMFVTGYIKNQLNSYGQFNALSNCQIYISFISSMIK